MTIDTSACAGGIIFSADSVRAIREGRKTQTRRLIKPQPSAGVRASALVPSGIEDGHGRELRPRYWPGKRYYVKETWCCEIDSDSAKPTGRYWYLLDNLDVVAIDDDGGHRYRKNGEEASPWISPMRMPRGAARYVIEVTEVRVQRLQDITEEDARSEGCESSTIPDSWPVGRTTAKEVFADAWDAINGKRAPWNSNPLVWVYTFKLVGGKA